MLIAINFVSSDNSDEDGEMHSKSDHKEIIIYDEADNVIKEVFESLLIDIKLVWKHQWEVVIYLWWCWICYITNVMKLIWDVVDHIDSPG